MPNTIIFDMNKRELCFKLRATVNNTNAPTLKIIYFSSQTEVFGSLKYTVSHFLWMT